MKSWEELKLLRSHAGQVKGAGNGSTTKGRQRSTEVQGVGSNKGGVGAVHGGDGAGQEEHDWEVFN